MEMIEISASDFCDSVRDGTHDSPKPVEGHGRPLVTTKHMKGGRVSIEDAYLISEADFEKVNQRSQVHQWDVLISMIGTLGELVLVKDEPTYAIKNIGLFKTKSKYDGLWLYYYLQSPKAKNHMHTSAQGSTQQYLSLKTLRGFPLSVPDSETDKRAICEVLKTIDDKIELNQKMNQTLEEIAKAIFKSWFVDFDPVRAKAEGRPTGLPPEISDLFPDEMVDSEIGEIPKGWEVTIVSRFGNVVCGKTPSTKDPENFGGEFPFITIPDMRGNLISLSTDRSVSEKGASALRGKMLPAGSICVSCIATPGLVSITTCDSVTNQQINSIVPFSEGDREYLLFSMMTFGDLISSAGSGGSVFANLSTGRFKQLPILQANEQTRTVFSKIVRPMLRRTELSQKEISTLSELRDTLLPKLISGELRIPDAEKFLEEAGI